MKEKLILSSDEIWYNELVEIQKKIDVHVSKMPSTFTFSKISK